MRKFKLNKDNSKIEPTHNDVKKYKDFSSISHNYSRLTKRAKKPLYKDPKMLLLLILLGVIAFLIFNENEKVPEKPSEKTQEIK